MIDLIMASGTVSALSQYAKYLEFGTKQAGQMDVGSLRRSLFTRPVAMPSGEAKIEIIDGNWYCPYCDSANPPGKLNCECCGARRKRSE